MSNPYAVLGLSPDVSLEEIKRAFRNLVKKFHPDHNPGDAEAEQKFKEVNTAYQILSDPAKKAQYDIVFGRGSEYDKFKSQFEDLFQHNWTSSWPHPSSRPKNPQRTQYNHQSPEPVRNTARRGENVAMGVTLTFAEACFGCQKKIVARSPHLQMECTECSGLGCTSCGMLGKTFFRRELDITFPVGVEDGKILTFNGHGCPGAPPGNLIITVSVLGHDEYTRLGMNLHTIIRINLIEYVTGCTRVLIRPDGKTFSVVIPPGIQSNHTVHIPRAGVPQPLMGTAGSLFAAIKLELPTKLTERGMKLLADLLENEVETKA